MEKQFEILRANRKGVLKVIEGLSIEQLNKIPAGFKNNLVWNVAHLVVTQQLLCYKLSAIPMKISHELVERFQKGSAAKEMVSAAEFEEIKALFLSLIDAFEEDYKKGIFKEYLPYTTSLDVTLHAISDSLEFNNYHEGIHLGYMLAMRKLV